MACWRLVNEPRGTGVGLNVDVEGVCATLVALVSPGLSSFFLLFLDGACVASSCTGDRRESLSLARLRFFRRDGRSSSVADADTPPRRVFPAGLAASCSITFSTFTVADWMSCLDFRLRFLGVTATGCPGTVHPGTSKRTMVGVRVVLLKTESEPSLRGIAWGVLRINSFTLITLTAFRRLFCGACLYVK